MGGRVTDLLIIAYAVVVFLFATTGLLICQNKRAAESFAVAMFVSGTSVVMLSMLASM